MYEPVSQIIKQVPRNASYLNLVFVTIEFIDSNEDSNITYA